MMLQRADWRREEERAHEEARRTERARAREKAEARAREKAGARAREKARVREKAQVREKVRAPTRVGPDPALFALTDGRWRVCLGLFAGPPADPVHLRGLIHAFCAPHLLGTDDAPADAGYPAAPDDLLVAASTSGALTCAPFLDILDGDCFTRAPCLCCYAARSPARAIEAGVALRVFLRYYDSCSYLSSRAFLRLVTTLSRDLRPDEVAEVAGHLSALDVTSDAVREVNGRWAGQLCIATPPCQPGVLWVYSTAAGRRTTCQCPERRRPRP